MLREPATLRKDRRYRGANPAERYVYLQLLAHGRVPADGGRDLLGSVVVVLDGLGDQPRDALAPILAGLVARGLVTMDETALEVSGPEKPARTKNAERQAKFKAKRRAELASVTGPVTASVTAGVTSVAGNAEGNGQGNAPTSDASDETTGVSGEAKGAGVTSSVTANEGNASGNADGGTKKDSLPLSLPSLASLSSLSSSQKEIQEGAGERTGTRDPGTTEPVARGTQPETFALDAGSAAKPAKGRGKSKPAPAADVAPDAGTLARRVYDALVGDAALAPIVANPGDFARRITTEGAYPGVNVLAAVLDAGEYVARTPGKYTDGRRFIASSLRRKADELARLPQPIVAPSVPPPASRPAPVPGAPIDPAVRGTSRDPRMPRPGAEPARRYPSDDRPYRRWSDR